MKVIIAGSRGFDGYNLLKEKRDFYLSRQTDVEIVSGTARGADQIGERYAKERGYKLTRFPADWDKHGKSAGVIRNKEMAEYADALIAFWDGKSSGTRHMLQTAHSKRLKYKIVKTWLR